MCSSSWRLPACGLILRVALVALAITALGLASAAPASAHAIVHSTSPKGGATVAEPPDQVVMRFNEPVEIAFGAIRVFDGAGRRVDEGVAHYLPGEPDAVAVALRSSLADGTYTVSWRVISADSHPIEEGFVFHVGRPGPQPEGVVDEVLAGEAGARPSTAVVFGATRWLGFASLLVLLGAVVFRAAVWDRGRTDLRSSQVEDAFARRWRRIIVIAWATLVVTTAASIALQAAVASNLPLVQALSPAVLGDVLGTRFGQVAVARLSLLLLAAAVVLAARPRLAPGRAAMSVGAAALPPPRYRLATALASLVVVALAVTPGLAGHAGTVQPVAVNLAADAVHVLAGAVWAGGLVLLIAAVFPATARLPSVERVRVVAPVVARFSNLAMIAVGVLVLTGVYRGWVEVRAFSALIDDTYGLTLLSKLAAFVPLLVLGAVNNRWLKPRLQRVVDGSPDARALSLLRRTVTAEVVLMVAVLGVTAVLVTLPPARTSMAEAGPFAQHITLGEQDVELTVEPNRVGENTITMMVPDHHGHGAAFETLEIRFTMPDRGIGPLVADATATAPDHYVVDGHQLSVPGMWELRIVGQVDRFTDVSASVPLHVQR
jgi:copper transport protein